MRHEKADLVLAVFLAFIAGTAEIFILWLGVTFASVAMSIALSCLELFVAFLQAYIFTFLSALFIGMALLIELLQLPFVAIQAQLLAQF